MARFSITHSLKTPLVCFLAGCLIGLSPSVLAFPELSKKNMKRHLAIIKENPVYEDEKVNAFVTRVGNKVLANSDHAGREYAFVVLDAPTVNAFVGGYDVVYIYRGLLAVINSEAELAGVIGHEIAHNVLKHTSQRISRRVGTNILATLSSILAGNSGVGNAILTRSRITETKYGQQQELDADELGAKYLYEAQYDPEKLTDALSQMSDYGSFVSEHVIGIERPHHGLRTTHPRTDKRLRKVIEQSGELPPGEAVIGRDSFREAVSGIIYGPNYARVAPPGFERYTNKTLGITFVYPDTWSKSINGSKIVIRDSEDKAQLKVSIEKTKDKKDSQSQLKEKYPDLVGPQKIHKKDPRDLGTIGAAPGKRVALVKIGDNSFVFEGLAKNNVITQEQDSVFVGIIRSFRKMTRKDLTSEYVTKIFYERLEPGETFRSIADESDHEADLVETELRIINGYFPRGEAEPGTWIKKLKKVKITQEAES